MAELEDTNLQGASFSRCEMHGCNLSGADLTNATLSKVELYGADLSTATLKGTKFSDVKYDPKTKWPGRKAPEGTVFVAKPDI